MEPFLCRVTGKHTILCWLGKQFSELSRLTQGELGLRTGAESLRAQRQGPPPLQLAHGAPLTSYPSPEALYLLCALPALPVLCFLKVHLAFRTSSGTYPFSQGILALLCYLPKWD